MSTQEVTISAREQRRIQWWKENRKKVENTEECEEVVEEADKTKRTEKMVKAPDRSTNLNKGFKSELLTPGKKKRKSTNGEDESSPKKRKTKSEKSDTTIKLAKSKESKKKSDSSVKKSNTKQEKSENIIGKAEKPPKAIASEGEKETSEVKATETEKKGKKYVLFIGNLPYGAQKHHLEKHFSKCHVTSVRLMTDKQTKRSRGFAYIELQNGKGFKQALLLHHSELLGREINVEFTTIGGGKSKKRAEKLKEKNERCERFKALRPEEQRYSKKDGEG